MDIEPPCRFHYTPESPILLKLHLLGSGSVWALKREEEQATFGNLPGKLTRTHCLPGEMIIQTAVADKVSPSLAEIKQRGPFSQPPGSQGSSDRGDEQLKGQVLRIDVLGRPEL